MSFGNIVEQNIGKTFKASDNPEKTIQDLLDQVKERRKQLEQEYWERCRFCECGADSVLECECSIDKRRRYMKRTSRKINDELGETTAALMIAKNFYYADGGGQE